MERYKGDSSNSSRSSTRMRQCYVYREWISIQQCECGQEMGLKTSWTNENPGRRYWECSRCKADSRGFVRWYDPPMCPRSKRIIPELLKTLNKTEEENGAMRVLVIGKNVPMLP
ncbi:uncharacterized protein LOC116029862 [Ipomoea triloba]|uniref:uncharacterized protein LOC116029862 n=1 Tax=Ipomoea triloba TaxID=35885 RepID=UPI00125E19D3|nr:uncharacterized protein LOC116029862 [Ipomoea triloba]